MLRQVSVGEGLEEAVVGHSDSGLQDAGPRNQSHSHCPSGLEYLERNCDYPGQCPLDHCFRHH